RPSFHSPTLNIKTPWSLPIRYCRPCRPSSTPTRASRWPARRRSRTSRSTAPTSPSMSNWATRPKARSRRRATPRSPPPAAIAAHAVQRGIALLPNVKNVIAVASGKGGVGKSTTAVNLALALAAEGARVGLLDADIYGPSQSLMMGIDARPQSEDGKTMEPLENYGVQVMSIGFLVDAAEAMIWRGPMAVQALEQLLR